MAVPSITEEVYAALKAIFGSIGGGGPRSGAVVFSGPNDKAANSGVAGFQKIISGGTLITEKVIIQNAQKDLAGVATAGNFLAVGGDAEAVFELAPGAGVELEWVDLSQVQVGYIGSDLTSGQIVVCKWIAHGRRIA